MTRKEVKAQVEEYAKLFRPYYNQVLQITVEPSKIIPFSSTLRTVRVATLADIKPLEPEKRTQNGKEVTPPFFMVEFEDGQLFFILEDIETVALTTRGVTLFFETCAVHFRTAVA